MIKVIIIVILLLLIHECIQDELDYDLFNDIDSDHDNVLEKDELVHYFSKYFNDVEALGKINNFKYK